MVLHKALKLSALLVCSGSAYAAFKIQQSDVQDLLKPLFFCRPSKVCAATIDYVSNWDDNWDKRAGEKSVATRHILLIRHGQYNMAGKTDLQKKLTNLGKEQAVFTGQRLKALGLNKKLTLITESSMTRAHETCELICQHLDPAIPRESSDMLREGAPVEPDPPVIHWQPEPKMFFIDGARIETAFRQFIHRAGADQPDESYELIVCHANVIRYFVCRALQLPQTAWLRMSLRHASITWLTIRPDGRVSLRCLGDAGHLPPDMLTFE